MRKNHTFNWNDELRDNRQNLVSSMLQHIVYTLPCEELVRMFSFTEAVKKQRQVVMIIKLVNFYLTHDIQHISSNEVCHPQY